MKRNDIYIDACDVFRRVLYIYKRKIETHNNYYESYENDFLLFIPNH